MKHQIISAIIDREGGYVDNKNDSGGATCYGITERVARRNGFEGHMSDLPRGIAFNIYANRYWDSVKADDIFTLSPAVCEEVVDTGVNMGIATASKFLQRSLNALTDNNLLIDGVIGSKTITALEEYIDHRGEDKTLLKALNCLQGAAYIELTEERKKDKAFIYGWIKHRVG